VDVVDIVRFRDGKVVEHWGVADQLGVMIQLGVVPGSQPGGTPPTSCGVRGRRGAVSEPWGPGPDDGHRSAGSATPTRL